MGHFGFILESRIGEDLINQINSDMVKTQGKKIEDEKEKTHKIRRN